MISESTYGEAAAWLSRQGEGAMDWEGFTIWLEADAQHRLAYDELALVDTALDRNSAAILPEVAKEEQAPPMARHPVRWARAAALGGGAIAAGLGALFWLGPSHPPVDVRNYRSGPTQTIQIALQDGGKVLLAPSSRLTIEGLKWSVEGSALFDIPHRSGRTLRISAGDFEVTDIGTRFTIENDPEGLIVELAEGSVAVSSSHLAQSVSLTKGQALMADPARGTLRLTSIEPQLVGSWRTGRLEFDNAPLALVARQISRYSGEQVRVDPQIADQPFSGVIAVNHGEAPEKSLAQILSLKVERVDGTVRLVPLRK